MEIIVEDISSYIKDVAKVPKALAIIRDVCRARPVGYQFMPRYKKGYWDGYISLMHSMNKFPTGLLWLVSKRLQVEGFHLTFTLTSAYPEYLEETIKPDMLFGVTLRDYQLEAIRKLLDRKRGIAKMATNAGKTEVMAGIIRALCTPKTMVIVNRKELLHQTADRFSKRLGIEIGKIGDGIWQPGTVTVAMIQTLYSKMKEPWTNNQLLMLDEAHHTSSDRTMDVVNKISGAYRFGFSGTPLKHEVLADMKLVSATGRLLCEVTNSQLIEQGFSATPYVHLTTITNGAEDTFDAKYQQAYKDMIVDNEYRNLLVADKAKISEGIVLVLVNQISHGHILNKLIPGSLFVHGSHDSEYRFGILEKMREGGRGVFIASPIFDEGVDVPAIDTIILACGGKSHIKLLQRIGRGMRKKGNGNVLTIHDFIDDTNKYLLKHSEERIDTYVAEGFETILD